MEHVYNSETDKESGITLKIVLDNFGDVDSPIAEDSAVIMAVFSRNHSNPAKDRLIPKPFGGDYWNMGNMEDAQAFHKANAHKSAPYAVFFLYVYEHGNTCYKASQGGNPFSCEWDSGCAGIIALKKSEVGTPGKKYGKGKNASVGKSYFEQAQSTCEIYTAWANGEVYGFRVEDSNGDELDACWGFIETEGADGYVLEAGRESMKSAVEDWHKEQAREASATAAMAKEFGMEALL